MCPHPPQPQTTLIVGGGGGDAAAAADDEEEEEEEEEGGGGRAELVRLAGGQHDGVEGSVDPLRVEHGEGALLAVRAPRRWALDRTACQESDKTGKRQNGTRRKKGDMSRAKTDNTARLTHPSIHPPTRPPTQTRTVEVSDAVDVLVAGGGVAPLLPLSRRELRNVPRGAVLAGGAHGDGEHAAAARAEDEEDGLGPGHDAVFDLGVLRDDLQVLAARPRVDTSRLPAATSAATSAPCTRDLLVAARRRADAREGLQTVNRVMLVWYLGTSAAIGPRSLATCAGRRAPTRCSPCTCT